MSKLADSLFTVTQQRVLGLLYSQPDRTFYTKEILRLTGMGVATIKRELDRMVAAGVLTMQPRGNQHHYQANPACPVYHELLSITRKTFGIVDVLKLALEPLAGQINRAFVFGSIASGKDSSNSDIDLMIIGDANFADTVSALYPAQEKLGREINPKIYNSEEWIQCLKKKEPFITEVLSTPRMDVIGGGDESG